MPIHYDIKTDELYLEGIEKGIEKGVINMLKREQFTLRDIVEIMGVSEEFVLNIAQRLGLKVIY